ncbi:hypothetical protein [Andreprevotia chitinilytica]|nr:hypothetical protein [Andreprevotia chitinilytica]
MAQIPSLGDADLERLGELEQLGSQRKTVLEAIASALLDRGSKKAE